MTYRGHTYFYENMRLHNVNIQNLIINGSARKKKAKEFFAKCRRTDVLKYK